MNAHPFDRYDTKKSHKLNHNHQGHRGKKNDNNSGSMTDDKYTHARSNRSNEKISSSEALAKDIEQASTIRPQGKHIIYNQLTIDCYFKSSTAA